MQGRQAFACVRPVWLKASKNFAFWTALVVVIFVTQIAWSGTKIESVELSRPEGTRHYLVAAPPNEAHGLRPLVILLHGHGGSAAQILGEERTAAPLSVWLRIGEREQLVIVAPDGYKGADGRKGWNDDRKDARNNPQTDDVALIQAIIDREIVTHAVDPSRVFVMGMSNGGMMTLRIASELTSRLAGAATVSASIAADANYPKPQVPLSILIISGTADPLVPYQGGDVHFYKNSRGAVIGIEAAAALWRELDRLPETPAVSIELPHRLANDSTRATSITWGTDPRGLQVQLIRINNGGHIEPSMTQRYRAIYTLIVGPQNGDLETAEAAWAFFKDKRSGLWALQH